MDESRRCFLKVAGVSLVGLGAGTKAAASTLTQVLQTKPHPNAKSAKRYAMVIDTKKCAQKWGCTACMDACHVSHNVPHITDKERHEVKWIWKETFEHTFPEQVHAYTDDRLKGRNALVLCNHCDNAPCVRVCPTQATWQREDGIVMMDMHRCIGCRFCVVACPYGSRSFNWKDPRPYLENTVPTYPTRSKGVVEKCTFCDERLAKGLQPSCVEACQKNGNGAMMFGDLGEKDSDIARVLASTYVIRRKPSLGTLPHVFYIV